VKLGIENRKQMIAAGVLGVLLLLVAGYEITTFSSTNASTTTAATATGSLSQPSSANSARPAAHHSSASASGKKEHAPQSLDPTLHLDQLAMAEEIKYEGSGRNIFVAQAEDVKIPTPLGPGTSDGKKDGPIYQPPGPPVPQPIPLKFFGFASHPGEPKKIFLSKGPDADVFIAGEGEIVDRRYKVVRISSTSVEMQDLVVSGPAQIIPLTQEKP
jgi:hypothetical protein